jgi:surface protein
MLGMFEVCTNLNSSITFTDTSSVNTMQSIFGNCTNFNQPVNFNTSSVNNMLAMFQNCTNFNQPVNFNTSNVNTMLAMFQGCTNFNQPVNFDTSSVTSMERMFYLCSSFNQIINFSTSSLTNTYRMMRNCVAFNSSFTLSDTSAVTTMQEMFFNAINFNEDISSFNISSLTNATSMLQSSAFDVTNYDLLLPAWDAYGTSGVTFHAGTAQYNCPIPSEAKANMLSRGWTITDGGIIPCSEFKMTIDTTQAGSSSNTFVLQLQDELTTFIVNWGDGNSDTITAWNQAELTHVYSVGGTYQISLDGFFGGFLYQTGDKLKISSIDQWGTNAFSKMNYAFNGCANMVLNATDEPDLLGCTNLDNMFSGCTSLNTEINWSSTSNVTNFLSFLQGCTAFNSNVTLNTDSALNFQQMFFGNTIFNSNVTFSDTSNVGSFLQMFMSCPVFNKPLTFDCSSLTTTYRMFLFCTNFNSALNFTNTSNLSNAFQMLYATSFDQDISTWDITSLTNGTGMLQNSAFSQTNYDLLLPAWDAYGTSNVPFHAGPAQYAAAPSAPATAHANMLGRGWTITDGGPI